MRFGSGTRWSRRKIGLAVMASIGILAMVGTTFASMVMPFLLGDTDRAAPRPTAVTPTSSAPAVIGAPLAVRPVLTPPLVARPEDCQAIPPVTAQEPATACDVDKAAVFELGPIALQLNLTQATEAKLPKSDYHVVAMSMDDVSSVAFARYTAANVGKQLAFVRDGVVLAAPVISAPIDGQSLQISGDLTAATASTIARLLREGT